MSSEASFPRAKLGRLRETGGSWDVNYLARELIDNSVQKLDSVALQRVVSIIIISDWYILERKNSLLGNSQSEINNHDENDLRFDSLHTRQVTHQAGAYPCFRSTKRLGVFLLPLDEMLIHRRATPSIKFAGTHLYIHRASTSA